MPVLFLFYLYLETIKTSEKMKHLLICRLALVCLLFPVVTSAVNREVKYPTYTLRNTETLEIEKIHPHKFRRTLATMAIDKGMPIEQLQQLLGHKRIDTTLQYAMVKQSNVKQAHRKYIG